METKFNFNSAVCTSRIQSEKLLALGLKKETADMTIHVKSDGHWYITAEPFYEWEDDFNTIPCLKEPDAIIPAWSLHRLVEMMPNSIAEQGWLSVGHCGLHYSRGYGVADNGLYESIVRMYEWLIKEGYFNKEYLVDDDKIAEHCNGVMEYLDYIRGEED